MTKTAQSVEEMISLGESMARDLTGGEVIALVGDLGAGKTHLCKGIVAGLESEDQVTSPTFALVNEYHGGRLSVFHFDFYRMESVEDVVAIGWEEYLDSDGIIVVEWADKFPECLPEETLWCRFSIRESDDREIEIG